MVLIMIVRYPLVITIRKLWGKGDYYSQVLKTHGTPRPHSMVTGRERERAQVWDFAFIEVDGVA